MATLQLTKNTIVADLRKQFNDAFGAQVKLYNGNRVAESTDTLESLGLTAEGNFECRGSLTVASFINRMKNDHGLKVKVYTCDEWVAVLDGLTLESAGKVKKGAVKADMESMIAYHRSDNNLQGYTIEAREDGGYIVRKDGVECDNAKAAMREIAGLIGLEYDASWTTRQFGAKLVKLIGNGAVNVTTADNKVEETTAEVEKAQVVDDDVDNEDVDEDEEVDDDDFGFCDNVEYKGIDYSCCDGTAEASMFVDEDLEEAESITIPQTVVDDNGNKYTVTGYVITDGEFSKITFPPTLKYIQGETFSDMDEDDLSELKHNLAENKNFIVKDRLIYQYNDFEDDKHVYTLVNVQLNRPEETFAIPEGVVALARSVFANCDELTEVIIPSSVRYIDFEPFEGCDSLERVIVYAPKSQIKCFDDFGEVIAKIEDIIPEGVTLSFVDSKTESHQPVSESMDSVKEAIKKARERQKESLDKINESTKKALERQRESWSNAKAEMKKSMLGEQSHKTTKKGCMPIILFIAIFLSIIVFLHR